METVISSRNKQLQNISEGAFTHKCKLNATSSEYFKCLKYLLFRIIHPLHSLLYIIYLRVKNRSAFCIRSSFLSRICNEPLHLQFYLKMTTIAFIVSIMFGTFFSWCICCLGKNISLFYLSIVLRYLLIADNFFMHKGSTSYN